MLLSDLRDELCRLYPAAADAERVCVDSGIPTRLLAFEGTCTQIWERVVKEAERRGKLISLVETALREYAEDAPQLYKFLGALEYGSEDTENWREPMPLDERDQTEIQRIRDSIHAINTKLTDWNLQRAVREAKDDVWRESVDRRFDTIEGKITLVEGKVDAVDARVTAARMNAQSVVSNRTLIVAALAALVIFTILSTIMVWIASQTRALLGGQQGNELWRWSSFFGAWLGAIRLPWLRWYW